ncbi:MAG: hypothetical protein ACMXX8_00780, partial [Candidatus Woesearchaeota archaeon]
MEEENNRYVADPHANKSAHDLLDIIKDYHQNTEEAALRRKKDNEEVITKIKYLSSIDDKYFIKLHGKDSKGMPKTYSLGEGEDQYLNATKLVNANILELIEHDLSPELVKEFIKKPDMIKVWARGKGIDYDKIVDDLVENADNINNSKQYSEMKQIVASSLASENTKKVQEATVDLAKDYKHHETVRNSLNDILTPHNKIADP